MLSKLNENKLQKHQKIRNKLVSFSDLDCFEDFQIEHVIDSYLKLKKTIPYLKINILNYNNFNDFYKSIYYISDESEKDFFDLTSKEKKYF